MTEHSLDAAEVGAVHEEVGSERVTEGVGRDVLGDAGGFGVVVDDALDGAGGESSKITRSVNFVEMTRVVEEEGGEGIVTDGEIVLGGVGGGFADENWAVFFTLTADDELATVEIDGIAIEVNELGDAETTGEEEFDDGAVTETGFGVVGDGV